MEPRPRMGREMPLQPQPKRLVALEAEVDLRESSPMRLEAMMMRQKEVRMRMTMRLGAMRMSAIAGAMMRTTEAVMMMQLMVEGMMKGRLMRGAAMRMMTSHFVVAF